MITFLVCDLMKETLSRNYKTNKFLSTPKVKKNNRTEVAKIINLPILEQILKHQSKTLTYPGLAEIKLA